MNVRITEDFNIHGGLFSTKTCSLRLIQNDTSYFVKLLFTYSGRHHIVLQNSELIFLFDKDSITLHAARNDTAANIWIGQYNFMRLIAKYSINKSDLFLLTKTSIAKIKFFTIKKPYELDIENSSAEAIKKYALCILNQ